MFSSIPGLWHISTSTWYYGRPSESKHQSYWIAIAHNLRSPPAINQYQCVAAAWCLHYLLMGTILKCCLCLLRKHYFDSLVSFAAERSSVSNFAEFTGTYAVRLPPRTSSWQWKRFRGEACYGAAVITLYVRAEDDGAAVWLGWAEWILFLNLFSCCDIIIHLPARSTRK